MSVGGRPVVAAFVAVCEPATCTLRYEPPAPQIANAEMESPVAVHETWFDVARRPAPWLKPCAPPMFHSMPKPSATSVEITNVYTAPAVKPAAGMSWVSLHAPLPAAKAGMPIWPNEPPATAAVMSAPAYELGQARTWATREAGGTRHSNKQQATRMVSDGMRKRERDASAAKSPSGSVVRRARLR